MEGMYEDMWTPYKHLYRVIEKSLESSSGNRIVELDIFLKKYKQNFSTLLKNPPKNEQSRNQLLNGMTEGVSIPGHSRPMLLSKDLVDESIIISDMFDLDEYLSMELLCTAQRQMSRHPGLPRGLVAILLYYDGRKAIAYSLRDLFQATSGMSWMTEVPKEVTQIITAFTQSLVEDYNILNRIIDLLETLDITKESVLLTKNRAFGPKKHQNQVLDLFEEIRVALATAFFNWSAQRGLSKNIVARLIQYFAKYKTAESTGNMDDVTLIMLMAFLYACDTSLLLRQEDTTTIVQNLPVLNETGFAQKVYEVIVSNQDWDWGCNTRLYNFIKFSYGLTLASLRQAPQNIQNSVSRIIDRDEQLIDESISLKIFDFIYYYVLEKDIIFKTEFFYRRIHQMFTDFIDFMHSKVTELRGRADETARTVMSFSKEGLDPPANLDHNFEMLMLCIGKFYKKNRCGLSLCSDYWGPLDMSSTNSKTTSRSVSLFKFIRLAGELLPPTLFVSYLKMIAGLSSCERSARNTFNLLKQVTGLSGSATLSWEHFFGSLTRYYSNLRREQCPGSDTIYKNRMLNRSINPQEIEGLRAVLGVIQAVANYDEVARVAICEHPNWAPIHVLLGLLSCSVPLTLKADIVKTLTALAKSKDTAIQLWNNLEASQIFYSLSTTNMCNLEIEIDQNECRLESFPLSQSVLEMLYTLVTTIIPKNLGVGPRKPGFDPYLTFIVNGIFLKFYNRNYRNPAEKWEVGEKCLKLLNYLLKIYEVNPQDFNENMDQSPPPGFHIMLQLHTKSDLLRLILLIIDEAIIKLDEYSKFFGKESLEECAFHCLNILEIGLSKQDVFFDAHSISNSSCLLSGLNKILLDVNPRSRRPDHILNTTKFITYGSWLPRHALVSVKILNFASRLPNINSQILGMLTQNEHTQIEIRHGFVECFEGDIQIPINNTENDLSDNNRIELEIKDAIIGLMQNCLTQPSPNITHFLLGFDVTKDNHWTQVQKSNSSSNCTRSLIALLDNHLEDMKTNNTYDVPTERIIEKGYSLLYSLCENQRTSDTILRYLRNCNDFLCRHISALPFKNSNQSHVLSQMSYLLKCTAIELKLTAHNSQISRFQHLCELLVGFSVKPAHENAPLELNHYFCPSNETRTTFNNKPGDTSSHMLLCHILDCIEFEMKSQSYPKWNFFENSLTEQILHDCETKTENGPKLINIKKLNDILNDELRTVQSSIASGQRQLILQEIESVLLLALQLNEEKNKNFATIKLMEAWGQVTEMLFTSAPELAIPIVTKQELILEILQKILGKIVPVQAIFELAILSSGTVLLLLVNLRYCHAQNTFENINVSRHEDRNNTSHMEIEKNSSNLTSAKSNALSLTFILRKIIEWIIISEVSSQKLRINLYAALLNCMCIVKGKNSVDYDDKKEEYFVSRLDKSIAKDNITGSDNNQIRLAVEVFKSFGEKLLDIICHDCIAGHDICKMSALSCIDTLLDLDSLTSSIHFVANRGYLSHIIDSLYKSDEGLCRVLKSSPDNMRALYVYESKMAMLLRVASNHVGAELLLGDKILGVLSGMKVFDMHPDIEINNITRKCQMEEFIPPADARYRQILFPALNLCDCIISTLGSENHSVISQVAHFLLSHCDMIETILRSGTPFMDLGLLKELTEITGLIARTANQELFALADANQDVGVNLYRLQRLMLSLFSRFAINETTLKEMFKIENLFYQPTEQNKSLHVRYFLEIASNLSLYCRNAISNHSVDHRSTGILFSPFVSEPIQRIDQRNNSIKITQNLGDILNQLKGSVEYYNSQKSVMDNLLRQRSSLPNLSIDTKARATFLELTDSLNIKQNELSLCSFITEQCLYLLWSHLDFYMLRAASNNSKIMFSGMSSSMALPTNAGNAWLMSTEDINTLKKNLISVFNETFSKQLLLTVESHVSSDKGYAEALLRRIKSLIQFAATN